MCYGMSGDSRRSLTYVSFYDALDMIRNCASSHSPVFERGVKTLGLDEANFGHSHTILVPQSVFSLSSATLVISLSWLGGVFRFHGVDDI